MEEEKTENITNGKTDEANEAVEDIASKFVADMQAVIQTIGVSDADESVAGTEKANTDEVSLEEERKEPGKEVLSAPVPEQDAIACEEAVEQVSGDPVETGEDSVSREEVQQDEEKQKLPDFTEEHPEEGSEGAGFDWVGGLKEVSGMVSTAAKKVSVQASAGAKTAKAGFMSWLGKEHGKEYIYTNRMKKSLKSSGKYYAAFIAAGFVFGALGAFLKPFAWEWLNIPSGVLIGYALAFLTKFMGTQINTLWVRSGVAASGFMKYLSKLLWKRDPSERALNAGWYKTVSLVLQVLFLILLTLYVFVKIPVRVVFTAIMTVAEGITGPKPEETVQKMDIAPDLLTILACIVMFIAYIVK